jgi:hypothetical protein
VGRAIPEKLVQQSEILPKVVFATDAVRAGMNCSLAIADAGSVRHEDYIG